MYIPNPPSDQKYRVTALVTLSTAEIEAVGVDSLVIATPHHLFVKSDGFPLVFDRKALKPLTEVPETVEPATDTSDTPAIEYTDLKSKDLIDFINDTEDTQALAQIKATDSRKTVLKAVDKRVRELGDDL